MSKIDLVETDDIKESGYLKGTFVNGAANVFPVSGLPVGVLSSQPAIAATTTAATMTFSQPAKGVRLYYSHQNESRANLRVISKTTAVTIGGGAANDTRLEGLFVTAALTGTCAITGFADSDGTAQTITLPAATAAGFKDFKGAINSAGALTFTCSNAADDNLVSVLYRSITEAYVLVCFDPPSAAVRTDWLDETLVGPRYRLNAGDVLELTFLDANGLQTTVDTMGYDFFNFYGSGGTLAVEIIV
ncbi:MAG TPA: hypothetical protein VJ742_08570 [Nitrososphaera sp.]|nr:hypothetical protein [Nitrososphaera sp.]